MTLRNTVFAFFLILAAVVVTRTGRGGTTSGGANATGAVVCSVSPQRPVGKDGRVLAAARFSCDSPGPDGLTVTVNLQRAEGGTWTTLARESFVSNSVYTTREESAQARTRQVGAGCAPGTFRTLVQASVYDAKHTTTLKPATSAGRKNPC